MDEHEYELPVLGGITLFLRWLEELIVLVSGPMLTAGLGIGLVALLSDGKLLLDVPWLTYAWAISQTVGVDGQLVGAWYRVSVAMRQKRWPAVVGFAVLGLLLAYVGFIAALIFALQEAYHLSTSQALAQLGLDATSWLWQRAFVSVFLVCLSGYLRYQAPRKKAQPSLEEQKRAMQEAMELEQLKQQMRAQRVQGFVGLAKGAAQAAREAVATPASDSAEAGRELEQVEPERGDREEVAAGAAAPFPGLTATGSNRSSR